MASTEYYRVADRVVAVLPELEEEHLRLRALWQPEVPGAINFMDEVFAPKLDRWLLANADDDLLRRAFGVIEDLANDPDPAIRDAIQVGVVNWIKQNADSLIVATRYMGPTTVTMVGGGRR